MIEPTKQAQQLRNKQPIQSETQPTQPPAPPKTTWGKNSLKNLLYLASLMGLVSLLFWLVLPANQPATLAQVTPVATATAGGWEVPITQTVVPTQTVTPEVTPTKTPVVIGVIVTVFPTPTEAPTLTPTPTFEPLSDKPIMGYVFSSPQEIPNTRNSIGGYEIIDWLPNSSEEILVQDPLSFKTINVFNGEVKQYATFDAPGEDRPLVWLTDVEGVAYLAVDSQTRQVNLWLGQAGKPDPTLLLADVTVPLISVNKGKGVAVYHKPSQTMQVISPDKFNLNPPPQPLDFAFPYKEVGGLKHTAYQPQGDWVVYYGANGMWMANTVSKEIKLIDLGGNKANLLWPKEVKWSLDGKKLALTLIQGHDMYDFSHIYVLDWPSSALHKVNDSFKYVTGIAWAPDSQHLLFKASIDQKDGRDINALFITNVSTSTELLPVPIPIQGLTSRFGESLSWSIDGQIALVSYFNDTGVALYQIKISTH